MLFRFVLIIFLFFLQVNNSVAYFITKENNKTYSHYEGYDVKCNNETAWVLIDDNDLSAKQHGQAVIKNGNSYGRLFKNNNFYSFANYECDNCDELIIYFINFKTGNSEIKKYIIKKDTLNKYIKKPTINHVSLPRDYLFSLENLYLKNFFKSSEQIKCILEKKIHKYEHH